MSDFVDPFAGASADEAQAAPAPAPAPAETVFDGPPAEAPAPAAPAKKTAGKKAGTVTVDVKPDILSATAGEHVATFKGGTGFDAPWYVVHASGLDEMEELLSKETETGIRFAKVLDRVQVVASYFAGLAPVNPNGNAGSRPQRQAAPAAAQQPPAGSPASPGDGWVYKTGTTKSGPKAGQTWQAWMPPDAAKAAGAKPVWF